MGYALARAVIAAGHKITLITGPTALRPPKGAKVVNVETGAQMFDAVKKHFARCDCLIMAAAVGDYTPVRESKTKIKKGSGPLVLKLKPTTDIAKWAGRNKKKQLVVGFALEDKSIRANAEKKLKDKNLDMIIANTPAVIGSEKAFVEVKTLNSKWLKLARATKTTLARKIIRRIENCYCNRYCSKTELTKQRSPSKIKTIACLRFQKFANGLNIARTTPGQIK
jgi:phosphopantothenoylcysteine synthetase/decarboxylase